MTRQRQGFKLSGRFKIPDNPTPDGRVCFCINIPDDPEHFAIFWGLLDRLGWRDLWDNTTPGSNTDVANYWRQIIADNRACFEEILDMANRGCGGDQPTNQRVLENSIIEESFDGGQTWSRIEDDPRFTDPIFTPITAIPGQDMACSGAASVVAVLREATNQITTNEAAWQAVNLLIGAILGLLQFLLPGIGTILAAIITTLAVALINLGRAALIDGMTEAVYEQLLCIFYCHINDDQSFDEAGWLASVEDVNDQITDTTSSIWIRLMLRALGPVGMTNAARILSTPAACDDCGCDPCGANGVWFLVSGDGLQYERAEEISPNVVRVRSVHITSIPNSEFVVWRFDRPELDGVCCRILGYQNPIPAGVELQEVVTTACNGSTGIHAWPWLGVAEFTQGHTVQGFNVPPYTLDIHLDPDTACP